MLVHVVTIVIDVTRLYKYGRIHRYLLIEYNSWQNLQWLWKNFLSRLSDSTLGHTEMTCDNIAPMQGK